MSQDTTTSVKSKTIIDAVQPTEDTLSSRGGSSLVARFFLQEDGWSKSPPASRDCVKAAKVSPWTRYSSS